MFASTLCHWAGSLQTASCLALCRLPEGSEGAGAQAEVGREKRRMRKQVVGLGRVLPQPLPVGEPLGENLRAPPEGSVKARTCPLVLAAQGWGLPHGAPFRR